MLRKVHGFALACLAGAALSAAGAQAEYPERPITLIVPFTAGGNSDVIARLVADHASEKLGQPMVVENHGGGGGSVGTKLAAAARPDGYTILFATAGTHSVNPSLRDVGYDPVEDFEPVSLVVNSSVVIVTNPSVPAKTLPELIELTSGGEELTFASGGVGTVAHVAGELYNELTGSKLIHVPYQGAGDVLNDLIAGRVDVNMNNLPTFLSHIAAGTVRPLAIAAPERSALLPDVPTTTEGGLPGLQMGSWFGIVAPKDTPPEIVAKLHEAVASIAQSDAMRERMAAIGTEPEVSPSPEAFREMIAEQLDWWGKTLDKPVFNQ